MHHSTVHSLILGLALATTAACDAEPDPGSLGSFDEVAASVEGIYRVDTHTENLAACAPGGDDLMDPDVDGYLAVKSRSVFGYSYLPMISCASPADCRDKLAAWDRSESFNLDFSFAVEKLASDGDLAGGGASTGYWMDDTCTEGSVFETVAIVEGDVLDITLRRTIADTYPVDEDGFCTTDLAREAAAGNQCSQFEQLTATFVDGL
jgi:hypothetical protein